MGSVAAARNAGATPQTPVATVITPAAKAMTLASMRIGVAGSVLSGFHAAKRRVATIARAMPQAPPIAENNRLSVRNWRTRRPRPDPMAARIAASRARVNPRPTSSVPTFMHAMSSRHADAPLTVSSVALTVRVLSA